jgi:hypothetical protein
MDFSKSILRHISGMSLNAPSKLPQKHRKRVSMHETVLEELCNIDDEDERLRISTSAYNLYQRYTMIMILDFIIVICMMFAPSKSE